jgi:hypothetical protein
MLGGGVSIIMQPSANFFQDSGHLDCIAGYIWSSNIFSTRHCLAFSRK